MFIIEISEAENGWVVEEEDTIGGNRVVVAKKIEEVLGIVDGVLQKREMWEEKEE